MAKKRPPKKTELLGARVPYETKRAFLEACEEDGRSASDVIRSFIGGYLARRTARARPQSTDPTRMRLAQALASPRARLVAVTSAAGAVLAAFVLVATPSTADNGLHAVFDSLDADNDGRLTLEELGAAPVGPIADAKTVDPVAARLAQQRREKRFAALDGDGDGFVSEPEYAAGPR